MTAKLDQIIEHAFTYTIPEAAKYLEYYSYSEIWDKYREAKGDKDAGFKLYLFVQRIASDILYLDPERRRRFKVEIKPDKLIIFNTQDRDHWLSLYGSGHATAYGTTWEQNLSFEDALLKVAMVAQECLAD